jgi:hypothetical protein
MSWLGGGHVMCFFVGPASVPMDWRDSEHVTCVLCALSVPFDATTHLTELDWRVQNSAGEDLHVI